MVSLRPNRGAFLLQIKGPIKKTDPHVDTSVPSHSMKCQMTPSTLHWVKLSPDFHSMQASLGDHSTTCRKRHLSECPSKIIQIWYILKLSRSLGWVPNWLSHLCKWLSTCASDWVSLAWVPFGTSLSAQARHSSQVRYSPWLQASHWHFLLLTCYCDSPLQSWTPGWSIFRGYLITHTR